MEQTCDHRTLARRSGIYYCHICGEDLTPKVQRPTVGQRISVVAAQFVMLSLGLALLAPVARWLAGGTEEQVRAAMIVPPPRGALSLVHLFIVCLIMTFWLGQSGLLHRFRSKLSQLGRMTTRSRAALLRERTSRDILERALSPIGIVLVVVALLSPLTLPPLLMLIPTSVDHMTPEEWRRMYAVGTGVLVAAGTVWLSVNVILALKSYPDISRIVLRRGAFSDDDPPAFVVEQRPKGE